MMPRDLGRPARVQIDRGRRRTWRTLWLRDQIVWDTVWYGCPVEYSSDRGGTTRVILQDQMSLMTRYQVGVDHDLGR